MNSRQKAQETQNQGFLQCNTRKSLINNKILRRQTECLNSWQKDEAAISFANRFSAKTFDHSLHAAPKIGCRLSALCS